VTPRLSIRRKLALLVLTASSLALICVAAAAIFYEATTFRPRAQQQLERQATILGEVLRPSLDFADPDGAKRYLSTYRTVTSQIAVAAVYDAGGRLFAGDRRDEVETLPPVPGAAGTSFRANELALWRPIDRNDQVLGYLYLREELPPLYERLPQYGIMAGAVFLALVVVAAVLIGGVQRNFLRPLAALVQTTGRIAKSDDYGSIRAPVMQDDELGQLAQSFNQMITVVGGREAALRESEERLTRLSNAAFEGIIFSKDGRVLDANERALQMLGYELPEAVGRPIAEFVAPESRELVERNVRENFQGRYESSCLRKDGSTFQIEAQARELFYGGVPSRVVAIRDITDRKRAEAEHTRLEVQLQQAQKMEAVGRLAGGVAHDFNNALTVILGQAEIAMSRVDPSDRLYANLQAVERAGRHSADLTRQLLTFARRQTVIRKVLDLNDTVAGMLKMLQRLIGEDIELEWRPGYELWRVKIDPAQVDQILANLCVNARDAIDGVGRVSIETANMTIDAAYCASHPGLTPGRFVTLSVSDDGRGIDPEVVEHIFEPFFTTKGVGEGTGLGLATVFGIVKQNDGYIAVDSEPGRGTTFRLFLPRSGEAVTEAVGGAARDVPKGRGETVLLVEDEAPVLELGEQMLQSLGYHVLTARTPHDAIRAVESRKGDIQLLVTDVVMPGMNGRELAARLLAFKPGLKCLYVSGYTADVIANRGVLDPGVKFLQKPFSMTDLALRVRDALA
jgi:PAS domain S-box-containing protein